MNLFIRLAVFILFALGVYFIPWWFLFVAVFVFMVIKRTVLFELLVPVFMADVIYGVPISRFHNFQFVSTSILIVMLAIVFIIKKYIRN
jgi:hypothetical protein